MSFQITADAYNKIDSLVASINSVYFGKEIYVSEEEKAVAYLYFLIKNHPFTDGNKRTACLSFMALCRLNELSPNFSDFSLDILAVFIEKIQESNHQSVIKDLSGVLFKM